MAMRAMTRDEKTYDRSKGLLREKRLPVSFILIVNFINISRIISSNNQAVLHASLDVVRTSTLSLALVQFFSPYASRLLRLSNHLCAALPGHAPHTCPSPSWTRLTLLAALADGSDCVAEGEKDYRLNSLRRC